MELYKILLLMQKEDYSEKTILLPRKIFEDKWAVYIMFDYFNEITSFTTPHRATAAARHAIKLCKDFGMRLLKFKETDKGQIMIEADGCVRLQQDLPKKYRIELDGLPLTTASTSRYTITANSTSIKFETKESEMIVRSERGKTEVEVRDECGSAATIYELSELPLRYLPQYRLVQRAAVAVRRQAVVVAVNKKNRQARLYADGRYEQRGMVLSRVAAAEEARRMRMLAEEVENLSLYSALR